MLPQRHRVSCARPFALLLASVVAVAALLTPATAQSPRDPRVDAIMNAVIEPQEPGASVIVIHDGAILHEAGYGMADLARNRVNTPDTLYHLGSTAKQMTALGIMILKERGLLSYDDPVSVHLPELSRFGDAVGVFLPQSSFLAQSSPASRSITLRQLMYHTSGCPDYYLSPGFNLLLAVYPTPDNEEALTFLRTWGQPREAGWHVYNNTGYDVLGTVILRKSSQSFDAFLQENVFQPAGMTASFSLPNPTRFADPNRARGYQKQGTSWVPDDWHPLDELVGAKSVYTSVRDLYAYDQALYTNLLVEQSTLEEAFQRPKLPDGSLLPYGFGWRLGRYLNHRYAGHGGDYEGYLCYIVRFLNDEFSIYLLANRHDIDPTSLAFRIFDVYEPNL